MSPAKTATARSESVSAFDPRGVKPELLREEPIPGVVVQNDVRKFGREANVVMTVVALIVAAFLFAWFFWQEDYLKHDKDLIYNIGLIGGIMMLLQFLYSMRKRITRWRNWGNLKVWFAIHMFIGIAAPAMIVVHSRFEIKSINGGVAFFSMLLVVLSGVVGRYLYSQINFDLAATREELKRLHGLVQKQVLSLRPDIANEMEHSIKVFTVSAFTMPTGVISAFTQSFGVGLRSRRLYWQLSQLLQTDGSARGGAVSLPLITNSPDAYAVERNILKIYLRTLTKLARYNAFKQLFSLWRVGHVPVIYILLLTGIAHVVAVHMY